MATPQSNSASRNRTFMLAGLLLMIIGVGSVYVLLAPRLQAARGDLETAKAQLRGVETDIKVLTTAQNQLNQAKQVMHQEKGVDFTKLSLVYPNTEDVPGLYLQLEALMQQGSRNGMETPVYQVGVPVLDATEGSAHIPVTVSAVGTYTQIKQFVSDLELNLRPLSIQTLNLTQTFDQSKGTADGKYTINIATVVRAETLSKAYNGTGT